MMSHLLRITEQMLLRGVASILAVAALAACASAVPSSTPPIASTRSASPSVSGASKQYAKLELFRVPMPPTDLAVSANKIFVAAFDAGAGARPPDVSSAVFEGPLDGGTAPREVPDAHTPRGTGILGVAVADDALYISASSSGPTGMFGVFRVANPPVAVAGGSSISGNRPDNGDGGAASAAAVHGPQGIAFSSRGDLFVAEAGDSRIRLVRNGIFRRMPEPVRVARDRLRRAVLRRRQRFAIQGWSRWVAVA